MSVNQLAYGITTAVHFLKVGGRKVTQVPAQNQKIPRFFQFAARNLKATQKFLGRPPSKPFRNIRGNRCGGAAHL